jgi:hypothetical protein
MVEPTGEQSHRERCAWAIRTGRQARAGDPAALAALAALEAGPVVDRRLALLACHTSHQGDRVVRGLADPSKHVRAMAYSLVPFACDEAQTVTGLARAWEVRRDTRMAQAVRDRGPNPAIDAHVAWLLEGDRDPRSIDLLPLASAEAVTRHLARALDRPSAAFWKRLLRYHPNILADVLTDAVLARPGAPHPDWRRRISDALPALCARAPDGALRLLHALCARGEKPEGIEVVARHRPGGVLTLLESWSRPLPDGLFASAVERMSPEERARAITQNPSSLGSAERVLDRCGADTGPDLLRAWLPVAERTPRWGGPLLRAAPLDEATLDRLYEAWSRAAQDREGIVARNLLDGLPPDLQAREARRHLHRVTELQTRPAVRLPYAEHLPWDEAVTELTAYTGHPDAGTRGLAVVTLLRIAGRRPAERELVPRALAMVRARKFEQDPIRGLMLDALAAWPREVWAPEHLDDVGAALRDALDASDLSQGTARSGERLVVGLFRLDSAWGTRWLGTWVKERGALHDPRLGAHLTDDEVRAAAAALLAIARAWSASERVPQLIALAQSLGARLVLVPGLCDVLEQVHRATPHGYQALELLLVLRAAERERYDRLLPAFLARWAKGDGWWNPLHALAQRLDVLDDALVDALLEHVRTGSHLVAASAVTILSKKAHAPLDRALAGLLAADPSLVILREIQWHLHVRRQDLLTPFLGHRVITGRFATGNTRWLLPFDRGFVRWSAPQQQLFAQTLTGLLAEPDRDTPTLLRVVSILPRLVDAPAAPLLALAKDERPVVREKAIRVLGRCDAGEGVPVLVECLGDERARFAIYALRAAVLETPPARAAPLLRGAPMRKVTVAKEIVRLLGELRGDEAYGHLVALDAGDLHRDVRVALLRALWDHLARAPTWDIYERAATGPDPILATRVGDVPADRLTVAIDARLSALLARVLDRPEPEARIELLRRATGLPVRDVARRFLAAVGARLRARTIDEQRAAAAALVWRATEADEGEVGRALAAARDDRRAVGVLCEALVAGEPRQRATVARLVRGALDAVSTDPRLAPLEVQLAAATVDGRGLAARLSAMSAGGRLHVGVIEDPSWRAALGALPPSELEPFEAALHTAVDPALRLAALRALERAAGPGQGWTVPRRARLAQFQADPSPAVSGAAQRVEVPREEPPPG